MQRHISIMPPLLGRVDRDSRRPQRQAPVSMKEGIFGCGTTRLLEISWSFIGLVSNVLLG